LRAKESPDLQAKFTGRAKDLETIKKLTRVGRLTLPGVFTREKVNPPAMVTLTRR